MRNLIYHTHISKTAGTSIWKTFCLINEQFYNDSFRISESQDTPFGKWMFDKKIHPDKGSIPSCEFLYEKTKIFKKLNKTRLYMERENPLDNFKLCPQFINSIVLREPLQHRFSWLMFRLNNNGYSSNGKLLCKRAPGTNLTAENISLGLGIRYMTFMYDNNLWAGCDKISQLDGFLTISHILHAYSAADLWT